MPADRDVRTEPPTPRRRREAREAGQVAKSQDLSAAVLLLVGLGGLAWQGPGIWQRMLTVCGSGLSGENPTDRGQLVPFALASATETARMLGPFLAMMVVAALVVMYAQVGLLWTLKPVTPSLGKLNPINGLRRMFSGRSVVALCFNLGKLVLVGAVGYLILRGMAGQIIASVCLDQLSILLLGARLAFRLGMLLALLLFVLAAADYAYQRLRHESDLKMTKEEVKDELRSMEGDPVIKRRRREVQMQLAYQRLRHDVPKADVVVSNPTHVAVALRYDPDAMAAPRVIAKGGDLMAVRIRQIAVAAGVPILERPPLARALFETVEVGREIPERFYQAVAEILAYVYELTGRSMNARSAKAG